jgi:hypothetical protein
MVGRKKRGPLEFRGRWFVEKTAKEKERIVEFDHLITEAESSKELTPELEKARKLLLSRKQVSLSVNERLLLKLLTKLKKK